MSKVKKKERDLQPRDKASTPEELPAAGPHNKEELIDRSKTPGTGMLPEPDEDAVDGASG
ncbi:hypothetical protein NOF55_13220 [Rhizobiaceae bacterium BDR2-2]|uniref:Uncharacterized protein n=1 Tax=Ectorhizobium quercum TaxID=2965071 RepID=A0AAE3SX37_9HYPH|nr:hypothetical protein [Ectorhizobium quercum]MCX8998065.1 hypothetical protein [Ectorhizobium quercum]